MDRLVTIRYDDLPLMVEGLRVLADQYALDALTEREAWVATYLAEAADAARQAADRLLATLRQG